MHSIRNWFAVAACLGLAAVLTSCGSTQAGDQSAESAPQDAMRSEDTGGEAGLAQMAAAVLGDATADADHAIPQSLLDHATAVVVIPNVTKAALGVGGQWGKGLAVQRTSDGWSAPAFVSIGGASYGFQVGAESTDLVLVFTGDNGLARLMQDHLKLGADASIAAGPLGRTVQVGTNLTMDSAIYSYSRTEGLFAGASLEGAVLQFDEDANHELYGPDVTVARLLSGDVPPAPEARPFLKAVEDHA